MASSSGKPVPARRQVGAEILAVEQLLHEERRSRVVLADVEHVDHVGVPHEVGRARFAQKAGDDLRGRPRARAAGS